MLRIHWAVSATFAMLALGCGGKQAHKPSAVDPGVSGAGGSSRADQRTAEADSIWAGAGGTSASGGAGGPGGVGGGADSRELEVSEFQSTSCTTSAVHGNLADLPELFAGRDPSEYFGLQCVAWNATQPESLLLDLVGFMETPYGSDAVTTMWKGTARQNDAGELSVRIEFDFAYPMMSSPCPHNFSMAVGGVAAQPVLPLTIATRNCSDPENCPGETVYSVGLPLADEPEGIVCRYLDESRLNAMQPGQPADVRGTLHRPPNDGQCDTGLVLLEIDPEVDWTLCAPSCSETDSECPLPELLTCQQSVCRLARTW